MKEDKRKTQKKPYSKPQVKSAKIYERLSLGCNKTSGPRCARGVLNS